MTNHNLLDYELSVLLKAVHQIFYDFRCTFKQAQNYAVNILKLELYKVYRN